MKAIVAFTIGLVMLGETMASNLERSKQFFTQLGANTMHLVDDFYDPKVVFQDPIHRLEGIAALKAYYQRLYSNVTSIRFEYGSGVESESVVSLEWRMFLKTPAIMGGKEFTVDGISIIKFSAAGKAIEHRDYFDMGEFVYERIPVLSYIIKYIKGRLSGAS